MKNILLWFVLWLCVFTAKAQTVTGKVFQAGTNNVVSGASVYYDGSLTGTITDKNGSFSLQTKARQIPLVISCVGYYSKTVTYTPGELITVYLEPKIEELNAVTIHVDGMKRNKEIELFTREFIGTSEYARSCIITNIDDVNLFYSKKTRTLTASCDKPIIIENKKLGYTISCYLDKFEKTPAEMSFEGNCIFKENMAATGQARAKINNNREDAYQGSRMQFIRALWTHSIKRTEFYMYDSSPDFLRLNEGDILFADSLGQKHLHLPGKIHIIDNKDSRRASSLTATKGLPFIDKSGFYGAGLLWTGIMGSQRIGDMLPLEYQSEIDKANEMAAAQQLVAINASGAGKAAPLIFEKAYLHTDRDVYAQGDTLWFKAYLVNAQDHKPISSSGTLYVELLAPDSAKILNREIIRMENGSGNGDMELIDSLPAGKYRLRAYTNWMRNFGDNFVFEKNITVLNTKAVPVAPEPAKKNDKRKSVAAIVSSVKNTNTATLNNNILPIVRFYPEGGSLVNSISAFIGVKAEDGYGKGISAKGSVISSAGDTVSHFSCDSLGMGMFAMLPIAGQSYHAVVSLDDMPKQAHHEPLVFQLPSALSKGLTLQIRQTDSVIHAIINSSDTLAKLTRLITVKHAGKIILNQQLQAKQRFANIATALLPEDISAITIYNEQGKPECERLVYVYHPGNNKISLSTDKKSYKPKTQVTVNISTQPNSNLSMAVVDAGVVPEQEEDIVSYLNLQSDIRGNIEQAHRYFDTTNVNRFKQLDLLLLTQAWRDFVWRRLADTTIRISYAAENGITVSGRVWEEVRNKMLPDANVSLYANGAKGDKLLSTRSNAQGRFSITGLMLFGQQNVKLASVDDKGKDKGTFLVDTIVPLPVKPLISKPASLQNLLDSTAVNAIEKRVETMKAAKIQGITQLKEVNIQNRKTVTTRSINVLSSREPDQVFNITPADYQYKTLEWYILQKVKGARESSSPYHGTVPTGVEFSGSDTLLIKNSAASFYVPQSVLMPPQIFVNGQELYMDANSELDMNIQAEAYRTQYFNMPMNKFKKVVLRHMSGTIHGLSANGAALLPSAELVNVDRYLLYLTMQDNYTIDNPGSLSIDVTGYYQARTFYKPLPAEKPSVNDYRTTIYWEPGIKTDNSGKATVSFYNAVPQTNARIIVQGITADGKPITSVTGYNIKQVN